MNNFDQLSRKVQYINNKTNINNTAPNASKLFYNSTSSDASSNSSVKKIIDDLSIFFDPINGTLNFNTFMKIFIVLFVVVLLFNYISKPNIVMITKEYKTVVTTNENNEETEEVYEKQLDSPVCSYKWLLFYSIFSTVLLILIIIGLINSVQIGYKLLSQK